ncbi:TlpA family protein disulfide reductase [Chitinophaga barathri]|nr:redoxin domain-containing protein [Chitinophaga barathri]
MLKKSHRVFLSVFVLAFGANKQSTSAQADGGYHSDPHNNTSNTILSTPLVTAAATGLKANKVLSADSAWQCLSDIDSAIWNIEMNDIEPRKKIRNKEIYFRQYLNEGLSFWTNFPDDQRKYKWAKMLNSYELNFWKDIESGAEISLRGEYNSTPVDFDLIYFWKVNMTKVRESVLSSSSIPRDEKANYLTRELQMELSLSKNKVYRENTEQFLNTIGRKFEAILSILENDDKCSIALLNVDVLFLGVNNFDLSFEDLRRFVRPYLNDPHASVRKWAQQKLALLDLEKNPLKFEGESINGQHINLENYRGKVVLLDFWNIYCSSCIARMPVIKSAYDKYKNSGFEVVSVNVDPLEDLNTVRKIEKRIKTEWPIVMIGGKNRNEWKSESAEWRRIFDTYGFTFVPQMILLDKEGKMRVFNGTLQEGDVDAEIASLLKQ